MVQKEWRETEEVAQLSTASSTGQCSQVFMSGAAFPVP